MRAGANLPSAFPRLTLSTPDVLVETFKRSEDGKALILRLFGISGAPRSVGIDWSEPRPTTVSRSDLSEKPLSPNPGRIEVPAYGIVTLRAELP